MRDHYQRAKCILRFVKIRALKSHTKYLAQTRINCSRRLKTLDRDKWRSANAVFNVFGEGRIANVAAIKAGNSTAINEFLRQRCAPLLDVRHHYVKRSRLVYGQTSLRSPLIRRLVLYFFLFAMFFTNRFSEATDLLNSTFISEYLRSRS